MIRFYFSLFRTRQIAKPGGGKERRRLLSPPFAYFGFSQYPYINPLVIPTYLYGPFSINVLPLQSVNEIENC
jgi:hypothetical protein